MKYQTNQYILLSVSLILLKSTIQPNSNEIRSKLLINYDSNVRPVLKNKEKVVLFFSAILNAVVDLDEKNQRLITSLVIKLHWQDQRLQWNVNDSSYPRQLVLRSSTVWVPDIYISNNADEGHKGFLHNNKSQLLISYKGHIHWALPILIKSSCEVNVAYFPFDHQFCNIDFTSWTYDSTQISFLPSTLTLDTKNALENTELLFVNFKITENSIYRSNLMKKYPQISVKIHLSRKITFYIYTVIIPSILLCFLTTFMFVLPSSHGGKIEIGLTVFLFLYFLQLIIAQNTPESNSMPLMGAFLFMIMTVNSISIIMSTIIVRIMYLAKCEYLNLSEVSVPFFVWCLVNSVLSKLTWSSFEAFNKSDIGHLDNLDNPIYNVSGTLNSQKWKYIAHIINRLLFEIFLAGIIITLLILLIYIPYFSLHVHEI